MSYKTWNVPMPTTAPPTAVATGTALKTMLQVATPSTQQIQLVSWGFNLSTLPGAASTFELIQTDVAATVTAHVPSGIVSSDPNAPASLMTLGSTATGYTASAEGSITATRLFDIVQIDPTAGEDSLEYAYQWMPDERPIVPISKFLRIRANTPTSGVNMLCWAVWNAL